MAKPGSDSDLEPRVDALELQVAALAEQVGMLEERVDALEAGATLPPIEPPIEPVTGLLVLELDLPDGALTFNEANAVDLGEYVGEFVHQRCLIERQGPWTVFFRPDVDGKRHEIVVEYGGYDFTVSPPVKLDAPADHILSPFTATVKNGTETVATVNVPRQYWLTRWRWQSAPRAIVRGHDDLVAMKAILPLDSRALWNDPADYVNASAVWTGPMGTGGLATYMGTTGDRPEIGPITNAQGSYLVRGNPEAEVAMLAQAEAAGSFPFYMRDPETDNLLDVYAHPYIALTHGPAIYPPKPANDPNFFALDTAHQPAVSYVPWLLTDDPYFLEGAQAAAIFHAIEANYHQNLNKLPGLVSCSQKRAHGWGLRDVLRMAALAPENPPFWLQGRAYFKKMAADNLTYAGYWMASEVKPARIFHLDVLNYACASWEEGYGLAGLAWVKWSGFLPEWDEAIEWRANTLLALTAPDPANQWNRRWPCPYRVPVVRMRTLATGVVVSAPSIVYDANPEPYAEETPDSWSELWGLFEQWMALGTPIVVGTEDKIYENRTDNPNTAPSGPHYHEVELGAVTALGLAGVPGAAEQAAWLRSKMQPVYDSYNSSGSSYRYAYYPA